MSLQVQQKLNKVEFDSLLDRLSELQAGGKLCFRANELSIESAASVIRTGARVLGYAFGGGWSRDINDLTPLIQKISDFALAKSQAEEDLEILNYKIELAIKGLNTLELAYENDAQKMEIVTAAKRKLQDISGIFTSVIRHKKSSILDLYQEFRLQQQQCAAVSIQYSELEGQSRDRFMSQQSLASAQGQQIVELQTKLAQQQEEIFRLRQENFELTQQLAQQQEEIHQSARQQERILEADKESAKRFEAEKQYLECRLQQELAQQQPAAASLADLDAASARYAELAKTIEEDLRHEETEEQVREAKAQELDDCVKKSRALLKADKAEQEEINQRLQALDPQWMEKALTLKSSLKKK